jgi:transcriptional accessory protein Tex/SPT6
MANYFVTNPSDVLKVGQQVKVKVIGIDLERDKVSLSMKDDSAPQAPRPERSAKPSHAATWDDEAPAPTMKGNITFS